ncbi:32387_t:CDS:2, partial [Racocetra persica]
VVTVASIVNATLIRCFKNLSKFKDELLLQFLKKTKTRSTDLKKSDNTVTNTSNSVEDEIIDKKIIYGSLLDNTIISSPPSMDDNIDNYKETIETIKYLIIQTLQSEKPVWFGDDGTASDSSLEILDNKIIDD